MTARSTARHPRRRVAEHGSATVFALGFAIVLLVSAGLVIDGGLALNARQSLADAAEQAARTGADAIDEQMLRDTGTISLDQPVALARASDYLAMRGYTDIAVRIEGTEVTAEARGSVDTAVLSLIGLDTMSVHASARAMPVVGIAEEEP